MRCILAEAFGGGRGARVLSDPFQDVIITMSSTVHEIQTCSLLVLSEKPSDVHFKMDKLSERHGPHVDPSHRAAGTALAVDFLDALENASKGGPGQSKGEDDIAVIGIVIKFPGDATSTDSFWNMLMDRRSALSDVPKDRYNNIDAFWSPGAFEPGTGTAHDPASYSMLTLKR